LTFAALQRTVPYATYPGTGISTSTGISPQARVGMYKLKSDAPQNAIETLSKTFIVPMLEKLLADGSIVEYEIDTEAIHTEDPGTFWIDVISPTADGLDKLNAALTSASKASPLNSAAFQSMVDSATHRDSLSSSTVTYK
jgi:hypothetical protein